MGNSWESAISAMSEAATHGKLHLGSGQGLSFNYSPIFNAIQSGFRILE